MTTPHWTFRSVAVVGSGAIGLYYGGRLAAAGHDVHFLSRSASEALRAEGLKVTSCHGDFALPQVSAFASPEEIGPVDLVIIALKTTANDILETTLPPLLHAGTQVLTLQNGLGNCETIAGILPSEHIVAGLCFVCINRISPTEVSHTAGGKIAVGEWAPGIVGRAQATATALKNANVPSAVAPDVVQAQWEKLLWNIPFNGLSIAQGGVTTDLLLDRGPIEREIRSIMEEISAAAAALGHAIAPELIDFNIERTRPMGPYKTSSMIDFLAGREIEIDSIWREPIRRAAQAGIDMPHTRQLLTRIEQTVLRPPPRSC